MSKEKKRKSKPDPTLTVTVTLRDLEQILMACYQFQVADRTEAYHRLRKLADEARR